MGPNGEGPSTNGFAIVASVLSARDSCGEEYDVLMACIADHKPDVVFGRKSDATGYIGRLGHINGEVIVVAESAGTGSRGERVAAFVRKVWSHD